MSDMQFSFDMKNWNDVSDGNGIIPSKAVQIYFRTKPKWEYQLTWSNSEGSFAERYNVWHNAVRKIKELEELGQECNVYVRNLIG